MSYCFVIQPFDKSKYDKRYLDTFSPSISKCGLTPYRVDKDPGVSIPIETIEEKIRNSTICFAEISTDNPNVWYELGFAIACGKEIIMVCCAEERSTNFPFDVRHRNIINYSTASISDYHQLSKQIEDRINATLPKVKKASLNSVFIPNNNNSEDPSQLERDLIFAILSLQPVDEEYATIYELKTIMRRKSYTDAAINLGIRKLKNRNMISICTECDYNSNEITAIRLSFEGESWLIDNENILDLRELVAPTSDNYKQQDEDDELPF